MSKSRSAIELRACPGLVLLTVAALILLVSRCNDGRGLNAISLLAGRLVTVYPSLEYLVLSHP